MKFGHHFILNKTKLKYLISSLRFCLATAWLRILSTKNHFNNLANQTNECSFVRAAFVRNIMSNTSELPIGGGVGFFTVFFNKVIEVNECEKIVWTRLQSDIF